MHRCQHSFEKISSNLLIVCVVSNSFQGISYASKPQVVSSYSFKSMTAIVFTTLYFPGKYCHLVLCIGNDIKSKTPFKI